MTENELISEYFLLYVFLGLLVFLTIMIVIK